MSEPSEAGASTPGQQLLAHPWLAPLRRWSPERRLVATIALLGALLYLPYLGAVGLWDPWETHYGEVAREMVHRNDYVYGWWQGTETVGDGWFLSKPPLTMWMDALGMQLAGTDRGEGRLSLATEWCMRLPFALASIAALCVLGMALARVFSRRAALAAMASLATMPMYWLLTRQAVTDTPFVAALMAAMACAIIAQFDERERHRIGYWYAFYVLCGLAVLAKEIPGLAIPAAVLGSYFALCEMDWSPASLDAHLRWLLQPAFRARVREGAAPMPTLWAQFFRMRLGTGLGVFLAVAGPWYGLLFAFRGQDDEGLDFLNRILHDNFARLLAGVHTTTPGGTFTYFIEQGGYALFPWAALVPGAVVVVSRLRLRSGSARDKLATFAVLWTAIAFLLVGASATKFHHYLFPVLPGVAILIGLFVDALWEEGLGAHAVPLLFGLVIFVLVGKDLASTPKNFTDLFVYNYERTYPQELVERPVTWLGGQPLWTGSVVGLVAIGAGLLIAAQAFRRRGRTALVGRITGVALLVAGAGLLVALNPRSADSLGPLGERVNIKLGLGLLFALGGGVCTIAMLRGSRRLLFQAFGSLVLAFALWFNWSHWVDLSHHWTQRDLFWRYWALRQEGEPIAAFEMNWKGETFYSRNTVLQFRDHSVEKMRRFAQLPGRKWALVEHARLGRMTQAVGAGHPVVPIDSGINNKFVLVRID